MTIPEPTKESLFALSHRLGKSQARLQRLFAAGRDKKHDKYRDGPFLSIFKDACALVHEAEVANAPYLPELLDAVQQIHDFVVAYAYRDPGMFEFMPSWAHNNQGGRPLVGDISGLNLPSNSIKNFLIRVADLCYIVFHTLTMFARDFGLRSGGRLSIKHATAPKRLLVIDEDAKLRLVPWNESMNRHPKSSRMARFRVNLPSLSASLADPVATAVYDARCEVSSTHTVSPIGIQVSDGGSFLAMIGACGWKNRTPGLNYYFLDKDDNPETSFPDHHLLEVGLANVASHMLLDERRRLIFIADGERVKSYTWGGPNGSYRDEVLPVHTLNSRRSSGPMTIFPNGTIVRAGIGDANVWRVSELETHGGNGKRVIGRKIAEFDSWRDDPEEIELSSGSFPNSKIQFVDRPTFRPGIWRHLVATPPTMICTEPFRTAKSYGCVSIDLETGKMPARYLGHGASIADFAVSSGDPQVFVTACSDGYARMYDARKPLPVLTLDACGGAAFCEAVAFAHPDGIPSECGV